MAKPTGIRLTKRVLNAMDNAVTAMLSGEEGEGDWDPEVSRWDLENAQEWVGEQLAKRRAKFEEQERREAGNERSWRCARGGQ